MEANDPTAETTRSVAAGNDKRSAVVVAVWLALVTVFAIVVGLDVYNELSKISGTDPPITKGDVNALWFDFTASKDVLILLVAASTGLLGAIVIASWGGSIHYANNRFGASWAPWYFVRVVVGGILGGMTVLAATAGLVTGGSSSADIEPAGVAVIGFVVGLASKKAMDKFEELIDVIFAKGGQGQRATQRQLRAIRAWETQGLISSEQATSMVESVVEPRPDGDDAGQEDRGGADDA